MIGLMPAAIHLLKVNNKNTRAKCEICSKITIKIPELRQQHRYSVSTVNFEHANASWEQEVLPAYRDSPKISQLRYFDFLKTYIPIANELFS